MAKINTREPRRGMCRGVLFASCIAAVLAAAFSGFRANANETDQFLLPSDKPFTDIGRYVSIAHYNALVTVTKSLNEEIRQAQEVANAQSRRDRLQALHDPQRLADMIRGEFGPGFFETIGMESSLDSKLARAAFPGDCYIAFQRSDWIYNFAHFPLDPRNIPLLVVSSTVRVYGHYLGTDKFGHFHDLGHYYFSDYTSDRRSGKSEEEAMRNIIETYSRGVISENGLIGAIGTGVCSNADLVANFMGFKFYRNLTEPVMLQGREHPPILVLVGEYWQLNTHVRPESDFMAPFFSDHWNEALNPCVYEWGLRASIARTLHARADEILAFYCGVDHRPREAGYFEALAKELSSYYGEDYGYVADSAPVLTIGTGCFAPYLDSDGNPDPTRPEPAPITSFSVWEVPVITPRRENAGSDIILAAGRTR